MNTTTIIINWNEPIELVKAMQKVSKMAQINTYAGDNLLIVTRMKAHNKMSKTMIRLHVQNSIATALEHYGARNKYRSNILPSIRALVWKYAADNYPKMSYRELGEPTSHDHSAVCTAITKAENLLTSKAPNYIREYKRDVFRLCDEIFKSKI